MDGYVYNAAEEPKILMTGKWNESMSYQPCDLEGEPLPGTELKEVSSLRIDVCILGKYDIDCSNSGIEGIIEMSEGIIGNEIFCRL